MPKALKNQLTIDLREEILSTLKQRFEKNKKRHAEVDWKDVAAKIEKNENHLYALYQMEKTGGEPDVVGQDKKTGEFLFYDCSPETPSGRRSICYDREALDSRKKFKPATSAMDMANEMGIEMLNEEEYRALQKLGKFDSKTSSWLKTPDSIRKLGGAIFADFRFNHIFVYHNGAESYYGGRGFRGCLRV